MFKETVGVNQDTDIEDVMVRLAKSAANGGLDSDTLATVLNQSRTVITGLFDRGTALINIGSKMSVDQNIEGPGYCIKIQANFGTNKSSWVDSLTRLLKR